MAQLDPPGAKGVGPLALLAKHVSTRFNRVSPSAQQVESVHGAMEPWQYLLGMLIHGNVSR